MWVQVQDRAADPVLGASVRLEPDGAMLPAGPNGWTFLLERGARGSVVASAPGYVSSTLALPYPLPDVLVIGLERGGSIRGRLVWPGWTKLPEETLVLALAEDVDFETGVRAALRGAPGAHRVRAAEDGRFAIDGLDRSGRFRVLVRAPGHYPLGPAPLVAPDGPDLEIELGIVIGVLAELRDEDGRPPRTAPGLIHSTHGPTWRTPRELRDRELDRREVVGLLAGIGERGLSVRSQHDLAFAFVVTEEAARLGPIALRCTVPGYEPLDVELWARPCRDGRLPTERIGVRALVREWGALSIRCHGGLSDDPRLACLPGAAGTVGTVRLRRGDGVEHEVGLVRYSGDDVLVNGIPAGAYEASFRARTGVFRYPDRVRSEPVVHLTIRSGEAAEFAIDLSNMSAVEIRAVGPDGARAEGTLRVRGYEHFDESGFHPLTVRADCPIVAGLSALSYRFRLSRPFAAESEGYVPLPGGEVTVVTLR